MGSNDKKPTDVHNELKGIRELLDDTHLNGVFKTGEALSEYKKIPPVLNQIIPELNERIELNEDYTITLDAEHCTETVEQQLVRTHSEQQPAAPNLIVEKIPELTEALAYNFETIGPDDSQAVDLIINEGWIKVETLLMENLPPQLSGAFLQLLNSRITESRQQLIDELSLLDEDSFNELLTHLDINQGF